MQTFNDKNGKRKLLYNIFIVGPVGPLTENFAGEDLKFITNFDLAHLNGKSLKSKSTKFHVCKKKKLYLPKSPLI